MSITSIAKQITVVQYLAAPLDRAEYLCEGRTPYRISLSSSLCTGLLNRFQKTNKSDVGRSTVIEEHQPLAILLRNCYERHPEFRLLLDALRKEGPQIHFPDLVRRLVHEYPNVFLNTFCTQAGRTRARELIEAGQVSRIYEEDAV